MPYACGLKDARLLAEVEAFAGANDFPNLYRSYSWRNDTYATGFSDIYALETQLSNSDRKAGITLDDVKAVAAWGSMRNQARISGAPTVAPPNLLHVPSGLPLPALAADPIAPLRAIQVTLTGIGPTYLSKILRFALPQEYGAIDTRCVRVFGQGDDQARQHDWLTVRARNDGYGWYILGSQRNWPAEYATWINILRRFAELLPPNCPHPGNFVDSGLRSQGVWECADVEMALFTYASRFA